jgi:hypothetical protein
MELRYIAEFVRIKVNVISKQYLRNREGKRGYLDGGYDVKLIRFVCHAELKHRIIHIVIKKHTLDKRFGMYYF